MPQQIVVVRRRVVTLAAVEPVRLPPRKRQSWGRKIVRAGLLVTALLWLGLGVLFAAAFISLHPFDLRSYAFPLIAFAVGAELLREFHSLGLE
jgi:hypothetical protein